MPRFIFLFLFCFLVTIDSFAQEDILKRRIDLSVDRLPLDEFLLHIAEQAGFSISFNQAAIDPSMLISANYKETSIREILSRHLSDAEMQITDNHLVILKKSSQGEVTRPVKLVISGFVMDMQSKEGLEAAVVYEISGLQSVLTDAAGRFELVFSNRFDQLVLGIAKRAYSDTLLVLDPQDQNLNIYLHRMEKGLLMVNGEDLSTLMYPSTYGQGVVSRKLTIRSQNISGFVRRPLHGALTPKINTNGKMAGSVRNMFSINLAGSYSHGIGMFQIGTYAINRYNVDGFQASILANFTGGNVKGAQIAGGINHTSGNQEGFQVSILQNRVAGDFKGHQIAGVYNLIFGNVKGFQTAGLINHAQYGVKGAQLAGGINVAPDTSTAQIAGAANLSTYNQLLQFSGFLNLAQSQSKGMQIGPVNITKHLQGMQLAGLINRAEYNEHGLQVGIINSNKNNLGRQIGLINITDTLHTSGRQIGLISLAKHGGIVNFDFSSTELLWANAALILGNRHFFNILSIGAGVPASRFTWGIGYGFGWHMREGKDPKIDLAPEFSFHWLTDNEPLTNNYLLFRNAWMYHFPGRKAYSFSLGPALNLMLSGVGGNLPPEKSIAPYKIFATGIGETRLEGWIGLKAGIKF
ncbi:MAG: hypothetical protein JJU28_15840 [Cyclobacteriaceae bacterium]|nr:hypothetical protein [Cyclobacteriaceae bacterium]